MLRNTDDDIVDHDDHVSADAADPLALLFSSPGSSGGDRRTHRDGDWVRHQNKTKRALAS